MIKTRWVQTHHFSDKHIADRTSCLALSWPCSYHKKRHKPRMGSWLSHWAVCSVDSISQEVQWIESDISFDRLWLSSRKYLPCQLPWRPASASCFCPRQTVTHSTCHSCAWHWGLPALWFWASFDILSRPSLLRDGMNDCSVKWWWDCATACQDICSLHSCLFISLLHSLSHLMITKKLMTAIK